MEYDKIIFACNNDDCVIHYTHLYVTPFPENDSYPDASSMDDFFCIGCRERLTFCELINTQGETVLVSEYLIHIVPKGQEKIHGKRDSLKAYRNRNRSSQG